MFRFGAIVAFICFIAAMGGYEHSLFGVTGMLIRMVVFIALMVGCHIAAEVTEKRKRAKRAGTRKAQNKNKYNIVYR